MTDETAAAAAPTEADPRAKEGSDLATSTAAATGTAEPSTEAPGDRMSAQLPGDTTSAKLDALHAKHFAGTSLATDTENWNRVHAFLEDTKRLIAEVEEHLGKR